ncbi:MAG TPA: Ig-like domain-containing protein, partial [Gemmatimonadales bacterium]
VAAVGGVATFADLRLDRSGGGYTLTASASGLGSDISVVFDIMVPVASVTVSPPELALSAGSSLRLSATPMDTADTPLPLTGRTVAWSSSNSGVATVSSDGLVTAVGVGSATVTATVEQRSGTVTVTVVAITFAGVAAGGAHTCGRTPKGEAYCWGDNSAGQLGSARGGSSLTPMPVAGTLRFARLTAGGAYTCGLTTTGAAYCWGDNTWGQVGNGGAYGVTNVPVLVVGGHTFTAIVAGFDHTCAITAAGQAFCWGWGDVGVLGADVGPCNELGFETSCSGTPVLADGGTSYVGIAAGYEHTCGLRPGGAAYCWGHEHHGQLGTGVDTLGGATARAVTGGLPFTSLSAGGNSTCGVAAGGATYCWGENNSGQVGNSLPWNRLAPTPVSGGLSLTSVSVSSGLSENHTCGLVVAGGAYCWGSNTVGSLGDGTTLQRTAPAAVAGGLLFGSISPGGTHTCGVTADNVAYCWGANGSGQLGIGSPVSSNVPVRVGGQR